MNWTIGKILKTSFGGVVVLILLTGFWTQMSLRTARADLKAVLEVEFPAAELAGAFEREMLNARIQFAYFVTVQRPGTLEAGRGRFEKAREILSQLVQRNAAHEGLSEHAEAIRAIQADFAQYESTMGQAIQAVSTKRNTGPEYDALSLRWAKLGNSLAEGSSNLKNSLGEDAQAAMEGALVQMARTVLLNGVLAAIGVLAALILATLIIRSVHRVLNRSSSEIGTAAASIGAASHQVAEASRRVAQLASEQAESIASASSACVEMDKRATATNRDSEEMAATTETGRRVSETGNRLLADMVEAMRQIGESSAKVSSVIRVIDDIAFQTNMLALNAAVEAARAGESGRGFAVVAEEVRGLAQRSADAAKETTSLIEESQKRSDRGMEQVGELAQALQELSAVSESLGRLAMAVREGSRQQADGMNQIANAVSTLEQSTQDNAATAQECASAATQLSSQAEAMTATALVLNNYVGTTQQFTSGTAFEDEPVMETMER